MVQDQQQGIYVTQDDIDAALGSALQPNEGTMPLFLRESDIVESEFDIELEEDEYFGLLSKDDIEALLHDGADLTGGKNAQNEIDSLVQNTSLKQDASAVAEEASEEKGKAAQEDVDLLIQDAMSGAETETGETSTEAAPVAQDDIDQLLAGALDGIEDEAGTGTAADKDGGAVPPETEGEISQDDVDRLLSDASEDGESDVEIDFAQPVSAELDSNTDSQEESGDLISQSDLDLLMGEGAPTDLVEAAPPEDTSEFQDEPGDLISQSDLDLLMGEGAPTDLVKAAPSDDGSPPSDHISQDDINRLLKESLEEEESPEDGEEDLPAEEEDLTSGEGIEAEDGDDLQEPVILAADEAPVEPVPAPKPEPVQKFQKLLHGGWKKRIGKRHLAWAMAAGIVLLVSVSFMIIPSGPKEAPLLQPQVLTFSISQTSQETSNTAAASANSIHLPGFIVLAPANSSAVAYVTADLTLDFSDTAIVAVIKENEAFVRDIIYGTIKSELMARNINDIDEISLKLAIRKALGRVVPRESIERIAFERFSLV